MKLTFACIAATGLGLNLWLLASALAGGGLAGCGGGCNEVLSSRWAYLLGVPVSAFGSAAYLLVMACLSQRRFLLRQLVVGGIAGSALWFVFLQSVVLKKFCPWCMAAHAAAFAMVCIEIRMQASGFIKNAIYVMISGMVMACMLIIPIQLFGPAPATHRLEGESGGDSSNLSPDRRMVVFDGGWLKYDVLETPRLGSHQAKHVLVEYFDYQCAACKIMSGYIDVLIRRHPEDLAVLLLPVPLDHACNPTVPSGSHHAGSCEISRIALAVWRVKPAEFPDFHRALIADASVAKARSLALGYMTHDELESALADPWIGKSIRSHIETWRGISATTDKLPKLLIRDRRILHGLPSGEEDFIRVMEKELGL